MKKRTAFWLAWMWVINAFIFDNERHRAGGRPRGDVRFFFLGRSGAD